MHARVYILCAAADVQLEWDVFIYLVFTAKLQGQNLEAMEAYKKLRKRKVARIASDGGGGDEKDGSAENDGGAENDAGAEGGPPDLSKIYTEDVRLLLPGQEPLYGPERTYVAR